MVAAPTAAPTVASSPPDHWADRLVRLRAQEFFVWSGMVVVLTLVTRMPFASHYLFSWDSANFALALDQYNVAAHQPHPPGYPLYVAAAWILRPLSTPTRPMLL